MYVTGFFQSGSDASFAGQSLPGVGGQDVFVAKYVDTSTGSAPATSSFVDSWATNGGSNYQDDKGTAIVLVNQQVYVAGKTYAAATFGSITFTMGAWSSVDFLARLTDVTLPLPTRSAQAVGGSPALYPNPASSSTTLTGLPPAKRCTCWVGWRLRLPWALRAR